MSKGTTTIRQSTANAPELKQLLARYGCGPVRFAGTDEALYERHLIFDNVMEGAEIGARERFEAVAHSVRDVLSQRWIRTEKTYERNDPKRVRGPTAGPRRRWLTMSRTLFFTASRNNLFRKRSSIGTICWSKNPTRAWAMADSGV